MSDDLKTPRLSALDPVHVGRDAAQRVLVHLGRLAFKLAPGVTVRVPTPTAEQLDATDLAATAAALTQYAQRGLPVWDWQTDDEAADAVQSLCESLASDALGTDGALSDVLLGGDELATDPVRLVLTGAWARVQLARREAVTPAQLAVLAGVHPSRVRALRAAGEIPSWTDTGATGRGAPPCPAAAAQRWLSARGVAGV